MFYIFLKKTTTCKWNYSCNIHQSYPLHSNTRINHAKLLLRKNWWGTFCLKVIKEFPWLKPILKNWPCHLLVLCTLQHQRYLELSCLPYLPRSKMRCLLLFLENFNILENIWQNRCSRVLLQDHRKIFF